MVLAYFGLVFEGVANNCKNKNSQHFHETIDVKYITSFYKMRAYSKVILALKFQNNFCDLIFNKGYSRKKSNGYSRKNLGSNFLERNYI